MSMTMEEENIKVAVRIRPMQTLERKEGDISCVKASEDGKEVQVKIGPLDASAYRCNQCFGNETSQIDFFKECGITELLDSAMKGYRSCAFAFGQTGAGKTFTMVGQPKVGAAVSHHNREKQNGLISRSLEYLFTKLEAAGVPFTIKMSCLEIYHEQVFDLSAEEKDRSPLAVREHAADGFFIEGSKLVECASYAAANAAFEAAARNRQTGSHDLNSRSSRSHCLTEIYIEIPVTVGADGGIGGGISHHSESGLDSGLTQGEYMSRGKISLVDLAGSERLKTTKSTGKVLQEAGFINKSLYVLGKVIAGLIRTNGDLNHKDVPYRDSKLTKLLISSLGGRSRTLLISCVSEAKSNMAETLRTLKFSMSCARIRNKPMKFLDPQEKLILDLKEEIKRLRNENKKLRSNLLTAPASGEKLGRMQSDDENNSVMSRAYSAHSSLEHERLQFKPRNGGKIYGTKMNSSQSDYIKKLSPIKKKRTGKAERKMTKKEALDMLDTMRAERMAKARAQAAGAPQGTRGGIRQDYDDDVSSIGSASNYNQPRAAASEMDDLVRRRATGPMIFRGDSAKDLTPVREMAATYSPAQNNSRSMDALRIAELERRIARMETGVLAQAPQNYPHDHHAEAHSELTRYHTTMEASGAAAMPLEHMLGKDAVLAGQIARRNGAKKKSKAVKEDPTAWKGKQNSASPYIAHLVEKAPKANQERNPSGEDHATHMHRTAPTSQPQHQPQPQAAAKHYNEDSDSGRPPVKPKPAGRSSADNLRSAVAAGRKPAPVKTEETKGKGPAKDLHSSILDELAELGLGPLPAASAATAPAPKKKEKVEQKVTIKANDRDVRSHSRSRAPALANASTSNTKNPSLPSLPATGSRSGKKQEAKKDLAPAGKAKILPPMMRERAKLTEAAAVLATPSKIASDPAALRMKLEALESSLIEERERMEDNPGEVTAETEEHYEELTKQARMLRKKLEMSGLDLSFQNDDVLDDSAPTPQAVRLMAQQMESLNKPFVRSTPAPTPAPAPAPAPVASPAPLSSEPRTSDLMFGRISRQASSVKQSLANAIAAAAEEEKNEDNDYADDDFEDDAKSKPGTASASARETSHIEAPAKMLQSKQFSRKFEELELNVPDVSRYIKPIPEKDSPKKQRRASITYASEEVFQVGTEEESASMRFSGLAAVHDALAFDSAEQPYARSPVNISAQFTPSAALTAPEREEVNATAASPAPSSKRNAPVTTNEEPEADEYEEDTYEDEFADEDAETETKPTTVASAKAPVSAPAPVPAPVPVVSAFSPMPAATASVPSHYDTPILVSPSKDKFGNSSKSNKNYEDFSSPVAPVVKAASPASVKVSPVPKAVPASASPPEENNYDEDNYEDAYEEEFEADASTRLPAEINTEKDATDEKHGHDEKNERDEKDEKDEAESTFISTKSSPAFVPTLPLASESAKKAKQDVAITPSSAKVITAESTTFSSPSAKLSTKASPAKQASVSKKRAQTPGETEAAGDDYGDEDFDEYDVSFED